MLINKGFPHWFRPLTFSLVLAGLVSWFSWGPIRWWLFSFIPENAENGWIAEIIITIVVGWVGGIGIPLVLVVLGLILWTELPKTDRWRL